MYDFLPSIFNQIIAFLMYNPVFPATVHGQVNSRLVRTICRQCTPVGKNYLSPVYTRMISYTNTHRTILLVSHLTLNWLLYIIEAVSINDVKTSIGIKHHSVPGLEDHRRSNDSYKESNTIHCSFLRVHRRNNDHESLLCL